METTNEARLKLVDMALKLIADDPDPRAPAAIADLNAQRAQLIERMGKPGTQVVLMKPAALYAQKD